jgi:hypothetical protein
MTDKILRICGPSIKLYLKIRYRFIGRSAIALSEDPLFGVCTFTLNEQAKSFFV